MIGFARRTQGLMVAKGNPLGLASLADLKSAGARFVNRALGTGTRVLLDEVLAREQAARRPTSTATTRPNPRTPPWPRRWPPAQPTPGLGIEAAARARGLDFVPLIQEDYYLVCLKSALDQPPVQALLAVLRSERWRALVAGLPGYDPHGSGEVLSLRRQLPWWKFKSQRSLKRSLGLLDQCEEDRQAGPSSRSRAACYSARSAKSVEAG